MITVNIPSTFIIENKTTITQLALKCGLFKDIITREKIKFIMNAVTMSDHVTLSSDDASILEIFVAIKLNLTNELLNLLKPYDSITSK